MGNYIDLAYVSAFTRTTYDATTTPTATTVNEYIDLSEQEINEFTGRTWGLETNTDEMHRNPKHSILLRNYPVISVTSVKDSDMNVLTEGIENDYIVDGDFIIFNENKPSPKKRVYVTYQSGYSPVRADAVNLTTLLVTSKIRQSQQSAASSSKRIQIGPITIDKALGTNTILNLDSDIEMYKKRLRRLVRPNGNY